MPIPESAGVSSTLDDGYIVRDANASVGAFIEHCRTLQYWDRAGSTGTT